jgi:hypothetical protein
MKKPTNEDYELAAKAAGIDIYAFGRWETRFSQKKGRDEWHFVDMTLECGHSYCYDADQSNPVPMRGRRDAGVTPGWWKRPAIFMPRAASR